MFHLKNFYTCFITLLAVLMLASCSKESTYVDSSSILKYLKGGTTDKVKYVEKTKDGGFIYSGITGSEVNNSQGFLMKVDANGKQEWYQTYGGPNFDEFEHAIQTSDGGYIAVGVTNSFGKGTMDTTNNLNDYVVKVNSFGQVEWEHSYNNSAVASFAEFVCETPDHYYLISGDRTYGYVFPSIMKIDPSGLLIYGGVYTNLNQVSPFLVPSNYYNVLGRYITPNPDGTITMAGVMSKSNYSSETHIHLTYIMNINFNNGALNYVYPYYNYLRDNTYCYAFGENMKKRFANMKMVPQSDGYLIVTYIEPTPGALKIQLLKVNIYGHELWEKEYSGLGAALFCNLESYDDGSIMISGASSPGPFNSSFPEMYANLKGMLLYVDANGNEIWTKYIGDESNATFFKSVHHIAGGGWSVGGVSCPTRTGYDKMFWVKLDDKGNIINQ